MTFLWLILLPIIGLSQETPETIPFVAYWSAGDSYDFQITKIQKRWREGELIKNDSSSYIANFEVLEENEDIYRIKWSYKANLTQEMNIPSELASIVSKYELREIIYKTSELGEFIEVENWDEMASLMTDLFDEITNSTELTGGIDVNLIKKAMEPFKKIFTSQEGIERLVLKELQYFHYPFGVEYSMGDTIFYEDEIPNLVGGIAIRGDAKIFLDNIDTEEFYALLIQEMTLNPEDSKKMVVDLLTQMVSDPEKVREEFDRAEFDIRDRNIFEFYYNPGVPIFIEASRTTNLKVAGENGGRMDLTRIEWVD